MSKILVWDLPTRTFHLLFAAGFITAFAISQFSGHHSRLFPYHMVLGVVLGIMLALRVLWGFVGTKYARFSSMLFSPAELLAYLRSVFSREGIRYGAHNPGSSYAILAMLILAGVVVATGLLMSTGSEAAEELHAVAAYALLAVAVVHVLGVVWHTIRLRENISRSMVSGLREGEPSEGIASSRPLAAVVFVGIVTVSAIGLFRNYDQSQHETRLPLVGTTIHLGEGEHD
jgi:cytochrome b